MMRLALSLCICAVTALLLPGCKREDSNGTASAATSKQETNVKGEASHGATFSRDEGAAFARASYRSIGPTATEQIVVNLISDSELEIAERGSRLVAQYTKSGDSLRAVVTKLGTPQVKYFKLVDGGIQTSDGVMLYDNDHYEKELKAAWSRLAASTQAAATQRVISISPTDEGRTGMELGQALFRRLGSQMDANSIAIGKMVEEVGKHIVASSDLKSSSYAKQFRFSFLNDQSIQAFALPGGHVSITRGLYENLENEAQLAAVLAHLAAHVVLRHPMEHLAGTGDAMDQVLQMQFTTTDEQESDSYGTRYMTQSGYDPREMVGALRKLRTDSRGATNADFASMHPVTDTRLQLIETGIMKMFPQQVPPELSKGRALRVKE